MLEGLSLNALVFISLIIIGIVVLIIGIIKKIRFLWILGIIISFLGALLYILGSIIRS
jgi:hypothetical protein